MSKILFSLTSGLPNSKKVPCFYEGFINALVCEGNEVLVIINNNIVKSCWKSNESVSSLNKSKLDAKILEFAPDLVFAWNNSLYENVAQLVSCPIIIYGVDSPAIFCDVENLKKNLDRYHIIVVAEQFVEMINENFGKDYKSLNIVRFATEIKAENIAQDKNISFIGTNFYFAADKFKKLFFDNFDEEKRRQFKVFLESFSQDLFKDPEYHLAKNNLDKNLLRDISHIDLLNIISSNDRLQTLGAVADLGLYLYGGKNWCEVADYSLQLALSFVEKEISSLQENQDIYNSSKISINISHAQAGNAFSWRVRDIMASNSALISDPRKDLETEFSKYVKIPTYENPFEARKLCEKLLKDDIWRKEIVANSQIAIEENHRFKHRMKDIEQIVGVSLFSKNKGKVEFLDVDEYLDGRFLNYIFYDASVHHSVRNGGYSCRRLLSSINRKRIKFCRRIKGKVKCGHCGNIK